MGLTKTGRLFGSTHSPVIASIAWVGALLPANILFGGKLSRILMIQSLAERQTKMRSDFE